MRRFLVVFALLIFALPAFSLTFSPKLEVKAGAEFYHSNLVSENIPFRTSFNISGDIVPLFLRSNRIGFGAGLSLSYTTRSFAYGYSIIKPYRALGPMIGFDWQVGRIFSLGLKSRLMFCSMGPVYLDKFSAVELELDPVFTVVQKNKFKMNVLVPLTAEIRKDGYCFRVGAGVGIGL